MNNKLKELARKAWATMFTLSTVFFSTITASATEVEAAGGKLAESDFWIGLMNILNDGTWALTIACPIIGGLAALLFVIRRSMADEQDGKMWTKRINIAIICGVGGMLVSGFIALLTSYF